MTKIFEATVLITQECDDDLDVKKVRKWLKELLHGCDLGEAKILSVKSYVPNEPSMQRKV